MIYFGCRSPFYWVIFFHILIPIRWRISSYLWMFCLNIFSWHPPTASYLLFQTQYQIIVNLDLISRSNIFNHSINKFIYYFFFQIPYFIIYIFLSWLISMPHEFFSISQKDNVGNVLQQHLIFSISFSIMNEISSLNINSWAFFPTSPPVTFHFAESLLPLIDQSALIRWWANSCIITIKIYIWRKLSGFDAQIFSLCSLVCKS